MAKEFSKINGYSVKDETARTAAANAVNTANSAASTAAAAQTKANEAYAEAGAAFTRADEAYALAEGRSNAVVYDSFHTMIEDLYNKHHGSTEEERTLFPVGTQLLIKEVDVPDYWVSGHLTTEKPLYDGNGGLPNPGADIYEIGFYEISMLESDKVDLTGYATSAELNAQKITLKIVGEELKILKNGVEITPTT